MNFDFKTIHEFNEYFSSEKVCYEFLEQQRWQGVPVCPHCGSTKNPYRVKSRGKFTDIPSYRCSERECDLPFTVRTNSIFEGSKVELRKWYQAIYEISIAKKSISSIELAGRIGVSQKTGWFINHRIRTMLAQTTPELLTDTCEVDESWIGGKERNRHQSHRAKIKRELKRQLTGKTIDSEKTIVFGLLQRDGRIINKIVPDTSRNSLLPIIEKYIEKGSTMYSDDHKVYRNLSKAGYNHEYVNHSLHEYVRGPVHTSNLDGYWSSLKRGIIGVFHHISHKHAHRYCDEFSFKYNTKLYNDSGRFYEIISKVHNARLTYKDLTAE